MYDNVQKLKGFLSICEMPDSLSKQEVQDAYTLLYNAKEDVRAYIQNLMRGKNFSCHLYAPLGDIQEYGCYSETAWGIEEEGIYLPFGYFSLNLWHQLLKDKYNPVFQLLEHFEACVRGIRSLLAMHGVSDKELLTCELLNEHDIMDIFSTHSFEAVYKDVFVYIHQ